MEDSGWVQQVTLEEVQECPHGLLQYTIARNIHKTIKSATLITNESQVYLSCCEVNILIRPPSDR